jgi:hypothetical protein
MSEHLDAYKRGWRMGDAEMILRVVADDFVYDHPVDGRITKADFGAYLKKLFADYEPLPGAPEDESFEAHSEEVTLERNGEVTAWNWWQTAAAEGAALKKAGPDGVYLERLTYFTRPGQRG